MSRSRNPTLVLGWREWVSLPGLGVSAIKAKLDTGARTSAIHAHDIELDETGELPVVRFSLHPVQRSSDHQVRCEVPLLDRRLIRSSDGAQSERLTICTTLGLAGFSWPIELTLVGRDEMGFRMLLGRQALRGRALVDPGAAYAAGRPSKKNRPR